MKIGVTFGFLCIRLLFSVFDFLIRLIHLITKYYLLFMNCDIALIELTCCADGGAIGVCFVLSFLWEI